MTLKELIKKDVFEIIIQGDDLEKEINKPFCCDLLSIAMSKAPAGSAWITVMGNVNTLAVAMLTEVSCIVLAEGVRLDDAALAKGKQQQITVLRTEESIFDAALTIHGLIHG